MTPLYASKFHYPTIQSTKQKQTDTKSINNILVDKCKLTGSDFEFLITPNDIEIKAEDFDNIMTPDSFCWIKEIKDNWPYYQIDTDEFSYLWEEPGIQMTFSKNMQYDKAKLIADEVIFKLSK